MLDVRHHSTIYPLILQFSYLQEILHILSHLTMGTNGSINFQPTVFLNPRNTPPFGSKVSSSLFPRTPPAMPAIWDHSTAYNTFSAILNLKVLTTNGLKFFFFNSRSSSATIGALQRHLAKISHFQKYRQRQRFADYWLALSKFGFTGRFAFQRSHRRWSQAIILKNWDTRQGVEIYNEKSQPSDGHVQQNQTKYSSSHKVRKFFWKKF